MVVFFDLSVGFLVIAYAVTETFEICKWSKLAFLLCMHSLLIIILSDRFRLGLLLVKNASSTLLVVFTSPRRPRKGIVNREYFGNVKLTIKHFSCIYVHPARTMQLGNRFDIFHMQRREIKHGDLAFIRLFYGLKRRWGETLKLRWLVHWVTILLL